MRRGKKHSDIVKMDVESEKGDDTTGRKRRSRKSEISITNETSEERGKKARRNEEEGMKDLGSRSEFVDVRE